MKVDVGKSLIAHTALTVRNRVKIDRTNLVARKIYFKKVLSEIFLSAVVST